MYLLVGVPQGSILRPLLFLIYINDQQGACEFLNSILFADDTNLIYRKNRDELFLLNKFQENIPKWLSVNKHALNIDKTQAITFCKNQGEEIHLTDSIIALSNCVKCLGFLID